MRPPAHRRELSDDERAALEAGLRASDAFVLRRCQILLANARGESVVAIAREVGCSDQTVHNVLRAFDARRLEVLRRRASRPRTVWAAFTPERAAALRDVLHQSPRTFGKPTSLWTLELAADVSFEHGLTPARVSDETVRATLARLGVTWKRAKTWLTSPDPEYARKKAAATACSPSRGPTPSGPSASRTRCGGAAWRPPALHAWAAPDRPLRLVAQAVAKDDPDPKALACYGLLVRCWTAGPAARWREEAWLRFVDGRPVSAVTTRFLAWCCAKLQADGQDGPAAGLGQRRLAPQ